MLRARMVTYWVEKDGSAPHEWEDGAAGDPGDERSGRNPRFVVADGATEAYDSIRWVEHLVTSFIDHDGAAPELVPASMLRWFATVQQAWVAAAPPAFASIFEERKFAQGSFATLLGCELEDLDGPAPSWRAVALGDVVLFHVRQRRLLVQFPPLGAGDFGLDPDGVHTGAAALPVMMERIRFAEYGLQAGDHLFLVTDALAEWIVRAREHQGDDRVWGFLSSVWHPDTFARFIADSRAARCMRNDDVTLMRVLVSESAPDRTVVCL
ncbi:hypothetical protein SAMN05660209_02102 [Geodermatophilus africanus]|uniref:Protein phosphatase 2C n=1 Tax=Geodermatophilus africanus TaxID=1137993 RepID=A0A1H3HGJ2_9ACTN|nr:hypothetical protein [Geodermatophilus africanus]SDY14683.1 hypothetical protein SAMN05660209_02102 [Geodermatophilus africanus]